MLQYFKRFTKWLKRLIMPADKANVAQPSHNSHKSYNSHNNMYDLVPIQGGPSPKEYGLYLLSSGKYRANIRKRKQLARKA